MFSGKYKNEIELLKQKLEEVNGEKEAAIIKISEFEQECSELRNENDDLHKELENYKISFKNIETNEYNNNDTIEKLRSDLEQLVGQDHWVIDSINEINKIGQEVKNIAIVTGDNINNMTEVTKDKINIVSTFTNSFEELLTKVKSIENISTQINGIASQTQLLSLNASIESARAGEAGRGFTIVADEIKKLSENTAGLLKDIQRTVKETYDIAVKAKEQVESLNEGRSDRLVIVKEANDGFEKVSDKIEVITEKISEIKKEGQNHLNLSRDIISTVSDIK